MDSYTPLLEKTRVPQPSFQKFAVISIFSKLRSAPKHLDADSETGRAAISQCLQSSSVAVVDQSIRELCRLVIDSKLDISSALLELQSAIEGTKPRFVDVFVKGIGSLVRFGFQKNNGTWRFTSTEMHPFVKVLSCRAEVQSELVHQVLLFMAQHRQLGMAEVCEFLRPFLNFTILWIPFSDSTASSFLRDLVSSMASYCFSFPHEALPIIKLFMGCLKYLPLQNPKEVGTFYYFVECSVDTYIMVLRHLVGTKKHVNSEVRLCGVEVLEAIISTVSSLHEQSGVCEPIVKLLEHLLVIQKDLGLRYIPELSSVILFLFVMLIQSEFEHEQLSILKFLIFLLKWKAENDSLVGRNEFTLKEELLFLFPVINLMSSPSMSVKGAATELLAVLEKLIVEPIKERVLEQHIPFFSTPGSIIFGLLQHLWFQDEYSIPSLFFLAFSSNGKIDCKDMHVLPRSWTSQLSEGSLWIVDRRKATLPVSHSGETFPTEISLLLGAVSGLLVLHQSSCSSAVDSLVAIGRMDPRLGVPLLLAVLFYNNLFSRIDAIDRDILLKLLGILPSIASHSGMIPLVLQTILPMLHKHADPVLYATATRLLCQTWEINDRAFGSLQGILHPKALTEHMYERNVCISIAASIRDVCQKSPDRGVDLILSVAACIESEDHIIQALGFQSLSHLCEADVIDFYTAWDVIEKHVLDYSKKPALAYSLCFLLRWAGMDAEAYPEASRKVLQILWGIGTCVHPVNELKAKAKARASAFEALTQFEVSDIESNIPDFKNRNPELLFSETDTEVLSAMEGFQVKILTYEHINRRRLVKEKRVTAYKIDKLLDVFPQVTFSAGKNNAGRLPGAALLCVPFTPKSVNYIGAPIGLRDVHAAYQNAMVELATSLQLSRNMFVAILSLQSWKSFMLRWMRTNISFHGAKASSVAVDKASKAANDILKTIMQIAGESLPKCAENLALAIGALCIVLPPSAHAVKVTASKFLLKWLFQYEHEHRQWSAAISLGLISSCLHVTDHKQKFQNISGLIEILCQSKSTLVRGACGIGLGFSCQDLLIRVKVAENSDLKEATHKVQEVDLLRKIVSAFSLVICKLSPSSSNILESLSTCLSLETNDGDINVNTQKSLENCDDLDEDIWGVAGVILGLGSSVGAIYRAGALDAVLKIKELIVSWIPHVNSAVQYSDSCSGRSELVLAVGSCIALPSVVAFCQRVELASDKELDHIVNGYEELISELVSLKKPHTIHQNLLMASCAGAGNLIASILNEGVHSMKIECIKSMLELFRNCYTNRYPSIIHLGGMLGVVNAMGARAGFLGHFHCPASTQTDYVHKDSSHILGPLLSNPVCESLLTSLVQEMFLVAQNFDDHQLQEYAAWAVAFLRQQTWSRELESVDSSTESFSNNFSEDSVLMKLCLWLMHLKYCETGINAHVGTVVTVLRCLSQAPRLPAMDWGAIIRRCMRYEAQVSEAQIPDSNLQTGVLREQCLRFSLAHASQLDPLVTFLDEQSDLSRFRTLEVNLQTCLFLHLADLIKIFSGSRSKKLFDDMTNYLSSLSSFQVFPDQKSLLRISCWKGIYQCLDEASLDSLDYICNIESCMEELFSSLPASHSAVITGTNQDSSVEEWSAAVRCLEKAGKSWLLGFLQVSQEDLVWRDDRFIEVLKRIQAKCKLVRVGSLPMVELGKLKAYILNSESQGMWGVLIDVVAALQEAEGSVRRQWIIDALEISCVSSYPSTALQFLSLLSGSCCKYMPLLILDQKTVLNDLPVTLTSLLSEPDWEIIAEPVTSYLWVSLERIYNWMTRVAQGEEDIPSMKPIDRSENDTLISLFQVLHHSCVCLKDYLPLDKQLKLSNMIVA